MLKRGIVAALFAMFLHAMPLLAMSLGGATAAPANRREQEILAPYVRTVQGLMIARMRGIRPRPSDEGRAVLRFILDRSGRVTATALEESSVSDEIDAAVLRALPVGSRLRAFPKGVTQAQMTFSVPVRFSP